MSMVIYCITENLIYFPQIDMLYSEFKYVVEQ